MGNSSLIKEPDGPGRTSGSLLLFVPFTAAVQICAKKIEKSKIRTRQLAFAVV